MAAPESLPNQVAVFKVDINDKISESLKDMVNAAFGCGGHFLFKGKIVLKDDTFSGINVLQNDRFLLMKDGATKVEPLMWRRFTTI